jgi:dihydrofolate reductase
MKGANFPNTKIISENLPAEIRKLKSGAGKDILIIGSPSAVHLLMEENLIDDYWLFVNPIILGRGIPLFNRIRDTMKLKLLTNETLSSGVICLHYSAITN